MMLGRRPIGLVQVGSVSRRLVGVLAEAGATAETIGRALSAFAARAEAGAASEAAAGGLVANAARSETGAAVDVPGGALLGVAAVAEASLAGSVATAAAGAAASTGDALAGLDAVGAVLAATASGGGALAGSDASSGALAGPGAVAEGAAAGEQALAGAALLGAGNEVGASDATVLSTMAVGGGLADALDADDAADELFAAFGAAIEGGAAAGDDLAGGLILDAGAGDIVDLAERIGSLGILVVAGAGVSASDLGASARLDVSALAGGAFDADDGAAAETRALVEAVDRLSGGESLSLGLILAALAAEATNAIERVANWNAAAGTVIRWRLLQLNGRLDGPAVLPARLGGPVTLPARLSGPDLLLGRLGGMPITHPTREVILGDGYLFRFPVDLGPDMPADLTNAEVEFGYGLAPEPASRENAQRPSASMSIGTVVIRGIVYQTAETLIPGTETAGLKPRETYHYACRVTLPGSQPETVARGTFRTAPAPL